MKLAYNLAITMMITGLIMVAVPAFARGLFNSIAIS